MQNKEMIIQGKIWKNENKSKWYEEENILVSIKDCQNLLQTFHTNNSELTILLILSFKKSGFLLSSFMCSIHLGYE